MNKSTYDFISSLYTNLLGRPPEAGALDSWMARVGRGLTTEDLVSEFFRSKEFASRKSHLENLFRPPGHFYSPIVNTASINPFNSEVIKSLQGLDISEEQHIHMWKTLFPHVKKLTLNENKVADRRYFYNNNAFCLGDASIYGAMLLEYKPKKVIEIGSGYSSAFLMDIATNQFPNDIDITFIEPYPELVNSLLTDRDKSSVRLIKHAIQDVDLEIFRELQANDILFIDSTHVLKTGSDVNFELFEILPILRPGVIVHIHDMFWPFEYPNPWIFDENRSWNEIYAVRAFLMNQDIFKIIYFNDYAAKTIRKIINNDAPSLLKSSGGSLWLSKAR